MDSYANFGMPHFLRWFPFRDGTEMGLPAKKAELQTIHDKIFQVKTAQSKDTGGLANVKMTDVIKQIITTYANLCPDDKWCEDWEFFPVTCSPMQGVEGRPALVKGTKAEMDHNQTSQLVKYQRLSVNPGYWFLYLLNCARLQNFSI